MLLAQADEFRVLREESESRMDGVRSHIQGSGHNALHIQVTVPGRSLSDADALIGKLLMKAVLVFLRVDRNAADAHIAACPDDPHRDLSAVRN